MTILKIWERLSAIYKKMNDKKLRLFLGCGPAPVHPQHLKYVDSSWVKIDKFVSEPGIVSMDIRKLEYEDNSVEEIYCSHTLEHIGLKEVVPTLKEWYRVLKPEGVVTINVPDMEWAAGQIVNIGNDLALKSKVFDTPQKLMEVIYGNQDHEGEFHKSGYTEETLYGYLKEAGFRFAAVDREYEAHEMGCLIAQAKK